MSKRNSKNSTYGKIDNFIYVTTLLFTIIVICISFILLFTKILQGSEINSEPTAFLPPSSSSPSVLGDINTSVEVIGLCGNDIIESPEECDGDELDDESCESLGYEEGDLACNDNCTFDTSDCYTYTPTCGNNVREGDEECDITDLDNESCVSLGYDSGTLGCYNNCTFDKSDCEISSSDQDGDGDSDGDQGESADSKDSDNDGIPDWWEKKYPCLSLYEDDADLDFDGDDLSALQEFLSDCDPCNEDSDKDGLPDGWEVKYGLNPNKKNADQDPDKDGFSNLEEYKAGTNPRVDESIQIEIDQDLPGTGRTRDEEPSWVIRCLLPSSITIFSVIFAIFVLVKLRRKPRKDSKFKS